MRVIDVIEGDRVVKELVLHRRIPSQDEEWATEVREGISVALPASGTSIPGLEPLPGPETRTEWLTASKGTLRQNLRQWTVNWRLTVNFSGAALPDMPRWPELIAECHRLDGSVPVKADGYDVQYTSFTEEGDSPIGVEELQAESVMRTDEAERFAPPVRAFPDILEAGAPCITGIGIFSPAGRRSLIILAWRQVGDEFQIFRRHVSDRELERKR